MPNIEAKPERSHPLLRKFFRLGQANYPTIERSLPVETIGNSDIVIVGNSISAFTLAKRLSKQDIPTTVIAPQDDALTAPLLPLQSRVSTPIIKEHVLVELGIPLDSHNGIHKRGVTIESATANSMLGKIVLRAIQLERSADISKNPKYFLDIDLSRRELYRDAQDDPNITLIDGRLTDLDLSEGKITKLYLNDGQEVEPKVVVDATGRQAIVSKKVSEKVSGAIEEKKVSQPSVLIGGFATLDQKFLDENPELATGSNNVFLPNGVVFYIAPVKSYPESSATHGIVLSGNTNTISHALKDAQEAAGGHLTKDERLLTALRNLTQGTSVEPVTTNIEALERTVFFTHRQSIQRRVNGVNLALVGDSQVFVNPISGSGFKNIASDIVTFTNSVLTENTLDEAINKYNSSSKRKNRKKIIESKIRYFILDRMFKLYQLGNL